MTNNHSKIFDFRGKSQFKIEVKMIPMMHGVSLAEEVDVLAYALKIFKANLVVRCQDPSTMGQLNV